MSYHHEPGGSRWPGYIVAVMVILIVLVIIVWLWFSTTSDQGDGLRAPRTPTGLLSTHTT